MKVLFNDIKFESNLGNIIRHAFCFGVDEIILTEKQRKLKKTKLDRRSVGFNEKVKMTTVNLQDYLTNYKGRKICPIPEENCKSIKEFTFRKDDLLLFGNEDNVPREIQDQADEFLYIPMDEKITKQCLNLATTFSIIAYEQWNNLK